jgi:prepilin-type N-terminal cleavage/methylation domain-containing protein
MKNQKGFTLVELMVVMAIIAILSTMGLSQYGNFIKNARDTTRVKDLDALKVVVMDSIQTNGTVPEDASALAVKIKEVAGKSITDPLDGKTACLQSDGSSTAPCHYQYAACDGGTGYILSTAFESRNNANTKYRKDDVSSDNLDEVVDGNRYEVWNCNSINNGPDIISGEVRI